MKKVVEVLVKIIVGVALISYLFYKIGVQQIIEILPKMNIFYFSLFLVSFFASLALGIFNIKILLDGLGYDLTFKRVAKYYTASWAIGLYAPGKLGEFSLVYLLKREKIGMGQSMAIAVLDKMITFIVFSLFSVIGFIVFLTLTESLWLLMVILSLLIIALFFMLSEFGRNLVRKYLLRRFSGKFSGFYVTVKMFIKEKKILLVYNLLLTVVKLLLMALSIFLLFLSFDTLVPFIYTMLIIAIGTIISLVPITFSGFGVREAASVYLFSKLGISAAVTLTVFLIALITNFIISAIVLFIVIKKMRLYEELKEAREIFR